MPKRREIDKKPRNSKALSNPSTNGNRGSENKIPRDDHNLKHKTPYDTGVKRNRGKAGNGFRKPVVSLVSMQ